MADPTALVARLRNELGDTGRPFQSTVVGDGLTSVFDLPVGLIDALNFQVYTVAPAAPLTAPYQQEAPTSPRLLGDTTLLFSPDDYRVDFRNGVLTLTNPVADGTTLVATGTSHELFTDEELRTYIDTALMQQTYNRSVQTRIVDPNTGFISYSKAPISYGNLAPIEEYPLVILAQIEALWTLATEASMDIDVETATGTTIPRTQRYQQLMSQIDRLQERYNFFAHNLNINLDRIEMFTLRRVSRTTGRYVPLYVQKEYDDYSPPERILPSVDGHVSPVIIGDEITEYNITLIAGDTFTLPITLPTDLTDATLQASIRGAPGTTTPVLCDFTITVLNADTGEIEISLSPSQTAALLSWNYYDLQVTRSPDDVTTYLRGTIGVTPQVTTSPVTPPAPLTVHLPGETAQNNFRGDPDPYLYTGIPPASP